MADITSSFDEILTELGNSFDADIASSNRKIVRSTANKIWLMLRAFSRGLYGLYQVVAALKYRFDPQYCTDDELASTMLIAGTSLIPGKCSFLTVTFWDNNPTVAKSLPADTYYYASANGVTFALLVQSPISIPAQSFIKRDFYSMLGGNPYIGSYPVSENSNITLTSLSGGTLDTDFSFDCADNTEQLGYPGETLFQARQRLLTDNQRQDIIHMLEETIAKLPNIQECTIIPNFTLAPVNSAYLEDDNVTPLPILPQSLLVIMTGSPTEDFALAFLSLCPFITTDAGSGVAGRGVVNYPSAIYSTGNFPVYYVNHYIALYDITINYGYVSQQISTTVIEEALSLLLLEFQAATQFQSIITVADFSDALATYQNPSVKILGMTFSYNGSTVSFMQFNKTQIARLRNINFTETSL